MANDLDWAEMIDRAIGPAPAAPPFDAAVRVVVARGRRVVLRRRLVAGVSGLAAVATAVVGVALVVPEGATQTAVAPTAAVTSTPSASDGLTVEPPGPDAPEARGAMRYDPATREIVVPDGWVEDGRITNPFGPASVAWSMHEVADPSNVSYALFSFIPFPGKPAGWYVGGVGIGRDVNRPTVSLPDWVAQKTPEVRELRARSVSSVVSPTPVFNP